MASILSRSQFDQACKAYVEAYLNAHPSDVKRHPTGWLWEEHPYIANLGYLSRTVHLPSRPVQSTSREDEDGLVELIAEDDDATLNTRDDLLTCKQYVVHSATFGVPTLYFTLHDASGSPLPLEEIMKSALFRPGSFPSADGNTFAVTFPGSSFAMLSQGDHPTLGTPSWYFHPCHTAEVVGELMAEIDVGRDDLLRWLEAWFMVMGNIVDFFAGSGA
ncbi:hypothetical protein BD311DRAFT_751392 [Dichomitus squalens]|uniref:Ubiquitin-like-conjugating enzyme ATG10 n=1 Tax=Dichomitus squalens TaxID=114155 RepID=A0A4Q9MWR2_9APHY|nr:hypothetical protein BD311DRAFT_751392 [Dichomitus squalens]